MLRNMRRYKEEVGELISEIIALKEKVADAQDIQTLMGIEGKGVIRITEVLIILLKIRILILENERSGHRQIRLMR
ncbi:CRISPR/Cas system-associated endonuclease Cas1 [Lysinibacillus sp. TE18511]